MAGEGHSEETIEEEKKAIRLHAKGGHGIEGCRMEGTLHVKRVPGNFHVQFTHDNLDYKNSLINATHIVNSLTFGNTATTPQSLCAAALQPVICGHLVMPML